MDGQDWKPVTLRRSGCANGKCAIVGGARPSGDGARLDKIEAGVPVAKKYLSPESVAAVQAYRRANSLTQKDLDMRLSWPANMTNAVEARRLTPTGQQLQQLSNLMRTTLRLSV